MKNQRRSNESGKRFRFFGAREALIFILIFGFGGTQAEAGIIDELKSKISGHTSKIEDLEKEIEQYQKELNVVSREKQSLETAIKTLDVSRKKISTDISVTENRIEAAELTIEELALEIADKERRIFQDMDSVAATMRTINQLESDSLIESFLAHERVSDVWDDIGELERFQTVLRADISSLSSLKEELEAQKTASEIKKGELSQQKTKLASQKQSLDINRQEKDKLLTVTKSTEANYKSLIEEKQALRKQFEAQVREFESQLRIAIDPTRLPPSGAGVLSWPLDDILVTQRFGYTTFAAAGGYNGQGHNGVDFRAAPGTPVKAALSGVVEGVGDTDSICPNASYGKWVFIKHANGLSSLYAHLSRIAVTPGQSVSTGDVVAYSGNTGYSTGPHLHMTVYATQGVAIRQLPSRVCNGTYTVPLADPKAYLDPLQYL